MYGVYIAQQVVVLSNENIKRSNSYHQKHGSSIAITIEINVFILRVNGLLNQEQILTTEHIF